MAMAHRVRLVWNDLAGTFWFVPGLIVLAMSALAVAAVELSTHVDAEALARFPRIFGASADSSRAMLSAIAGAMITVAGLTFSLTMVAVTQASSQYTPRILRNFMRDRGNQVVLGVYVGIFAYCLLVVRTIRSGEEGRFVPSLAVVLGIALAIGSVGMLIFFVHHIASGLQASTIVHRVTHETLAAIDRLFPESVGAEAPDRRDSPSDALPGGAWVPIEAPATGYVQSLDGDALLRIADVHDLVLRLVPSVGDFVIEGTPIVWALAGPAAAAAAQKPDGTPWTRDWRRTIPRQFAVSSFRTVEQDAAFGVRQLVDIALKALSPGVNDTTTAVLCIDHLGAILVRLAPRRVESHRRAVDGTVRLLAPGPTFESLLALAVDEIRQSAGANVGALTRVLTMLESVASCTPSSERRRLIAAHVAHVGDAMEADVPSPYDRARLAERVAQALEAARLGPGRLTAQPIAGDERVTDARQAPPRSPAG
jgi:uncharacterized membrane protein